MTKVYLGIGTNLGDKERNILKAYDLIEKKIGRIVRRSSIYRTEPWGFQSENEFLNTVICVDTELTPQQLLAQTQQIERQMGRKQKSRGGEYHDRVIDIDILLYGDETINEPNLVIPHLLMKEREFVMKPLGEIRNS